MSGNGLTSMEGAWCFVLLVSTLGSCNAFPKPVALLCMELTLCRAAESDNTGLSWLFLSDSFATRSVWTRNSLVICLFRGPYLQFKSTVKSYLELLGLKSMVL